MYKTPLQRPTWQHSSPPHMEAFSLVAANAAFLPTPRPEISNAHSGPTEQMLLPSLHKNQFQIGFCQGILLQERARLLTRESLMAKLSSFLELFDRRAKFKNCKNICVCACEHTGIVFIHLLLCSMFSQQELLTRPFSGKKKLQERIFLVQILLTTCWENHPLNFSLETKEMCLWKQLQSKFNSWYYGYSGCKSVSLSRGCWSKLQIRSIFEAGRIALAP